MCKRLRNCSLFESKRLLYKKYDFFNLTLIEPKGNRCFAVLGIKTFEGQNTFNVECEDEEDSIKYVDYISILIQRYKSIGEERRFSFTI